MVDRVLLASLDEWPFSSRLAALLERLDVNRAALRLIHFAHSAEAPDDALDGLDEHGARPRLEPALLAASAAVAEVARKALGLSPAKRGSQWVKVGLAGGFHWSATRAELRERFRGAGFRIITPKAVSASPPLDWLERLSSSDDRVLGEALRALPGKFPGLDTSVAGLAALLLARAHEGGTTTQLRRRLFTRLARLEGVDALELGAFFEHESGPVKGAVDDLRAKQVADSRRRVAAVRTRPKTAAKTLAPARPPGGPSILRKDAVFVINADDPAYLAVVDLGTYRPTLPGWSFDSLTRKITSEMNAGHLVAFGTPEDQVRLRLTTKPYRGFADATTTATLAVTGALSVVTYTSLTMAADGDNFPEPSDPLFQLPEGKYRVEVHRRFAHRAGAQFADAKLPKGDHYVLVFRPLERAPKKHAWVPWALPPAKPRANRR